MRYIKTTQDLREVALEHLEALPQHLDIHKVSQRTALLRIAPYVSLAKLQHLHLSRPSRETSFTVIAQHSKWFAIVYYDERQDRFEYGIVLNDTTNCGVATPMQLLALLIPNTELEYAELETLHDLLVTKTDELASFDE